MFDINV